MSMEDVKRLAPYAAGRKKVPTNFTEGNVDDAFRKALNNAIGSISKFERNKYDLFEIIIEQVDEVVPAKVISYLGAFAEIKTIEFGQKAMFRSNKKLGQERAKKFLTRVGLSGVYETFRLDKYEYEVSTYAIGTGISIDFDRILNDADSLSDLLTIVADLMTSAIFSEIQRALRAAVTAANVPAVNRVIDATFDSEKMFKLISVVKAYAGNSGIGQNSGAVIFAPPEFIGAMGPDAIVPPMIGTQQGIYHPDDIASIHNTGYIKIFRGTQIVEIPQSYIDTNNVQTWIDPQLAYILPTGGEKVVKIVLEGGQQMWDAMNRDRSYEIMFERKIGTTIETYYNWGIYQNTSIPQTMYDPFPNL